MAPAAWKLDLLHIVCVKPVLVEPRHLLPLFEVGQRYRWNVKRYIGQRIKRTPGSKLICSEPAIVTAQVSERKVPTTSAEIRICHANNLSRMLPIEGVCKVGTFWTDVVHVCGYYSGASWSTIFIQRCNGKLYVARHFIDDGLHLLHQLSVELEAAQSSRMQSSCPGSKEKEEEVQGSLLSEKEQEEKNFCRQRKNCGQAL